MKKQFSAARAGIDVLLETSKTFLRLLKGKNRFNEMLLGSVQAYPTSKQRGCRLLA